MQFFVTTNDVARFLGLSPRTILRMAREERIPAILFRVRSGAHGVSN